MPNKQQIIAAFDPGGVGLDNGNIFGFPFSYDTADIIILGVPWEVTVSFHSGTAKGPKAVLDASPQLDFYDYDNPEGWKQGICMPPIPDWIEQKNGELRWRSLSGGESPAQKIVTATEQGQPLTDDLHTALKQVNDGCAQLNQWLLLKTRQALNAGKKVGILGGDHSVPLGALQALAEKYPDFGILHIDAHCDLRDAYQGFTFSHASIMRNAIALPQVSKLIQVGIRDVSHAEIEFAQSSNGRIRVHHDTALKRSRYQGTPWQTLCAQIVADLPPHVYISFDIDGLDPKLCPTTGTPVPGGLDLDEAFCLLREVADHREIIGFDLCEVGPDEWDGNVGARIIYKLCNLMGLSRSS
ncbi:MAG: agmatinase [Leptolyngbya foveolarum]|uniref:Agmatinase n=1 Tax=Leptolyngbya foveolarum TaxID=47253 RepID=A0A2W4UEV6_9CYAN|nr:MAG: agmatinase [Leptolyngbya foveolarum]